MRRLLVAPLMLLCLNISVGQASDAPLSGHPQWLSLLHFDNNSMFSEPRSAVLDGNFFLAGNGQHDSAAELDATLAALRSVPEEDKTHARCRFPARALWLSSQTGEQWPEADCPEWETWQQQHADAEIGLMFASGYLGNPASFFGHLMLHLEQQDAQQDASLSRLLDTSLNFGANVPENENIAVYMAKGLFGGYEARYSRAPFYRNTALYSEREMRDLWHYQLSLSDTRRQLLVAHLFEVIGQNYDYLFLSENCASRIARTLELVIEEDLTPGNAPWVAPETLVRAISQATIEGQPLLKKTQHVPSRRLQTEWRFQALTAQEQEAAQALWPAIDTLNLSTPSFQELNTASQTAVLDTLLGHAAFLRQTGDEPEIAELERQLLQARLKRPISGRQAKPGDRVPLHDVNSPALIRLEGIYNEELGAAGRLTFRPLQYDLLDSNDTRMPSAALEIGRIEIDLDQDEQRLSSLVLFDVTNLHARSVPLPALPNVAWHASGEVLPSHLGCQHCLEGQMTLLAGKSHRLGRHLPFAMVGGRLRSERYQAGPLPVVSQLGVLSDWGAGQRTLLEINHANAFKGADSHRTYLKLQHRLALGDQMDMRAGIEADEDAHEVSLGFSWYF